MQNQPDNLSDKLINNLYNKSLKTQFDFYQYLSETGNDFRKSLDIDSRLPFTFDVSVITSRLLYSTAYFLTYKAFSNKEVTLERLKEFTDRIDDIPKVYISNFDVLRKYKELADDLFNSAIKHREILCTSTQESK